MKKKLKQSVPVLIILLLAAAFILPPIHAAQLSIRVYFDDIEGSSCTLYYAPDSPGAFSQSQSVAAFIDPDSKVAVFALDPSLENRIAGLRLDFPDTAQLLRIKSVTISSAGVIKRQYDPCRFFAPENILSQNSIEAISLATAQTRAYIKTASADPYLVFSDKLCREINSCYSHFRLTRLCVCLFLLCVFLLVRKSPFREDP